MGEPILLRGGERGGLSPKRACGLAEAPERFAFDGRLAFL